MILDYQETRSVNFDRPLGDGGWGNGSSPYPDVCQYCQNTLTEVLNTLRWRNTRWQGDDPIAYRLVSICRSCGWWLMKEQDTIETATIAYSEATAFAILRSFDVASADIPLNTLREYLRKHEKEFYNVNPTKFEQLVGDVFRDFYDCEVAHVGRTGDNGIDLLMVDADHPLPIQVKRRADSAAWEPVSTVREFLGALLLQGFQRGAIVTTAGHFSNAATMAVRTAQDRHLVEQFELFDMPRFLNVFKLITPEHSEPAWRAKIPKEFLPFVDNPELGEIAHIKDEQISLHYRISLGAYGRWLTRDRAGTPGDALGDWLEAEKDELSWEKYRRQWRRERGKQIDST